MNVDFTAEERAFQQEVRDFFDSEFPEDLREKVKNNIKFSKDDIVRWQKILNGKGWMAPNWPVEYGGTGWTATQKHIFNEEMGRVGAPEPVAFGVKMVAPVIMAYGSEEQKQRFLPDILESRTWWCQMLSQAVRIFPSQFQSQPQALMWLSPFSCSSYLLEVNAARLF